MPPRPALVVCAAMALPLAAAGPLLVNALQTYQVTARAAQLGLTYGPRLPLHWLFAALLVGAASAGAVAIFGRHRSASRWLFGAAAVLALAAAGSAARPSQITPAVIGGAVVLAAAAAFWVGDRRSDGRTHRSWLGDARARRWGLALGIGGCISAVALGLAEDERILPRSPLLARGAVGLAVLAGLFALLCAGAMLVAWAARQESPGRRRLGWSAVAAGAVSLLFGAFATYSLGFHWKPTARLCAYGSPSGTLDQRRRDTREGVRRANSVFSFLPELVGFRVRTACAEAQQELELIDRGECPYNLIEGMSCRCGAERVPDDVRCKYAQCVRSSTTKLRCPDDP